MSPCGGATKASALEGVTGMGDRDSSRSRKLSEVEAHQLLARAAELDARLEARVTTAQLSAAALEAGISAEALAQATADLEAGKLASPARNVVIRQGLASAGRVVVATGLVWWLLVDASRPLAQGLALAFAVYGAYKALGWLGGRLRQGLKAARSLEPDRVLEQSAERADDRTAMRMRLFAAPGASRGTA